MHSLKSRSMIELDRDRTRSRSRALARGWAFLAKAAPSQALIEVLVRPFWIERGGDKAVLLREQLPCRTYCHSHAGATTETSAAKNAPFSHQVSPAARSRATPLARLPRGTGTGCSAPAPAAGGGGCCF